MKSKESTELGRLHPTSKASRREEGDGGGLAWSGGEAHSSGGMEAIRGGIRQLEKERSAVMECMSKLKMMLGDQNRNA